MAEVVNQHMEDMLNELEQMKRIDLYTVDEIRKILKKRKEFEYKIKRKTKCKNDFLNYISYECLLIKSVKLRREKFCIDEKKNDIEYTISKRITRLYKEVINRFPQDLDLWLSFFQFCKEVNFCSMVTTHLERLLQFHGDKPKIWELCGRWEYEEMNNIDNARKVILKGLHRHPKYAGLYIDSLRIELLVTEAIDKVEQEKYMKKIEVIMRKGIEEVNDVNFIIKMIIVLENFEFANSLRVHLFEELWKNHINNAITWEFIAQCEYERKDTSGFDWKSLSSGFMPCDTNIGILINVYEAALAMKSIENLHINYINHIIKLFSKDTNNIYHGLPILNRILTLGHESCNLSESHYKVWINLLCLDPNMNRNDICKLLEEACHKLPSSRYIWEERLKRATDDTQGLFHIFKKARRLLCPDDVNSIWIYVIEQTKDVEQLRKLRDETMCLTSKAARSVRPSLLKALYDHGGIETARTEYDALVKIPPLVLETHMKMLEIEVSQNPLNYEAAKRCCEMCVQQFGHEKPEVWLAYVEFEIKSGHSHNCGKLYARACATLKGVAVDAFVSGYHQGDIKTCQ